MNVYFLVEGKRTEVKVYPAWLSHLVPELQRVESPDRVTINNYFLVSGEGYPSLLYDHLPNSIEDIKTFGKYDYLAVCLDAEENTVEETRKEVEEFLADKNIKLGKTKLVLIIQNRCIETWFLGNRRIYSKNPQSKPLLDYTRHYDVSVDDPETMQKYAGFNTHAAFHEAYLKALFEAKNICYTKKRPGDVVKPFYLEELISRIESQATHLMTFRSFIEFCKEIRQNLSR